MADNRSRKTNTRKKTLCKGERELVDKGQGQIYERLLGVRIREQTEISVLLSFPKICITRPHNPPSIHASLFSPPYSPFPSLKKKKRSSPTLVRLLSSDETRDAKFVRGRERGSCVAEEGACAIASSCRWDDQ